MAGGDADRQPVVLTPARARAAIAHLAQADAVMAEIVARVGPFRMAYREPDFETLVRSVVYQQISGKAAMAIFGRLQAACGNGRLCPDGVLTLSRDALRGLGLSSQKARYVWDLAEKTRDKTLDFSRLPGLPDDAVIAILTQVTGVGRWTAQMFLMFALRRPDVLPVADLGVRAAMQRAYRLRRPPTPERMQRIARPWHPYASVASWYLWRSLENFAAL